MTQSVDLKDFVSQSVLDILDGVNDAKNRCSKIALTPGNCAVAPGTMNGKPINRPEQLIEFEIQTVVTNSKEGGVKIHIFSGGICRNSQNIQKIKFSVPVVMGA